MLFLPCSIGEFKFALFLRMSMYRRYARFTPCSWRWRRPSTRRQTPRPPPSLHASDGGDSMMRRNRQHRPCVPIAAFFLLPTADDASSRAINRINLLHTPENITRRRRRHPIQVFLEMPTTTSTPACFERQIIAFLRPEILMALSLGPRTRPATCLQVS